MTVANVALASRQSIILPNSTAYISQPLITKISFEEMGLQNMECYMFGLYLNNSTYILQRGLAQISKKAEVK